MATTVDTVFRIWNDTGYGYEVGSDADGFCLEVRYYEDLFSKPVVQRMSFGKDDAIAIAEALLKLAKEMK